jgi:hypothetical protein
VRFTIFCGQRLILLCAGAVVDENTKKPQTSSRLLKYCLDDASGKKATPQNSLQAIFSRMPRARRPSKAPIFKWLGGISAAC